MALWDGRFDGSPAEEMQRFGESLSVDLLMWREDIMGSKAHATMLHHVGLLNGDMSGTKLWVGTTGELFTSVYLASVFLPCLITLLAIWREMKIKFAVKLVIRQSSFAIVFSIVIGWVSHFISKI